MSWKNLVKRILGPTALAFCVALPASPAAAQALFFEDFEGDLSQWVPRDFNPHPALPSGTAEIVDDPIRVGNRVLTFDKVTFGADIVSSEWDVAPGNCYIINFEYLGIGPFPSAGSGGTIGFSQRTDIFGGAFHRWLVGTFKILVPGGIEDDPLIDDDQWHTYSIVFDPFVDGASGIGTRDGAGKNRVIVEDYGGGPGIKKTRDAFFDNIRVSEISASDFLPPMGNKKNLGSTLPVKFKLFLDGLEVKGQDDLDLILKSSTTGLHCPEIRISDITGDVPVELPADNIDDNVGEGGELETCFRFADEHWIYNLKLDPNDGFEAGSDYLVEIDLGPCILSPGNAVFQTK